ncbi:MAG: FecR family protein [Flavobacteriaceae bacterium]|nr:FecR family protein [Flavobacteriaceae bacterium]
MKNNNLHNKDAVFLAKWMANEMTDRDLKKLVNNEDFLTYLALKKGILLYERLEEPLDNSFKIIQNKIENSTPKVKKLYLKWVISIAASLVLFFSISNFFKNQPVLNTTNFGEQKTITLLDSSKVTLTAKSEIKYHKKEWKNKRELFLNGEAFFKVKKGSKFTVKTKNGKIEVLGTQFNVNSNKDFFEVTCYFGKVNVIYNAKEYILLPGQGFRKIIGSKMEKLITTQTIPTWLNGVSTYKSVPLKHVILDLEKQFDIKFDATKINTKMLFTGSFNHKNKKLAFTTVFKAMYVDYKEINDSKKIILTKK